jgi:metal-dependent HD superfamily phosphatase/phosphodiesterase
MITLVEVKKNKLIREYINQTHEYMKFVGFTDHGFKHSDVVAERARLVAKAAKLSPREQELAAIAGYCHDMGNFLGRTQHHYWGGLLFGQTFQNTMDPRELAVVMQAVVAHDKDEIKIPSKVAACLVVADKSDVRRTRVFDGSPKNLAVDIHDRLNYATTGNDFRADAKKKTITLTVKIDTNQAPVMEYFEIFTERMEYSRKAAAKLGFKFGLVINHFKLL